MTKRFLSLLLIVTVWLSCSPTEPQDNPELSLKLEDVSCTEAWITIKTTIPVPAEINLRRTDADGNSVSQISILNTQDSLLYIDSLLPNTSYRYQVSSIQYPVYSNEIIITTLDTTSSNFTFTTWTFDGTAGSSSLYDVAIINENNIWAVGEIYVADTSENGYTLYNAVHWDGNDWNLKRIFYPSICGSPNVSSYRSKAIFVFDNNEIWITSSGDKIAIIKDGVQTDKFCLPSNVSMSINKIWGTSSSDLYVVGYNGTIAHYNGSQWTRIESGTTAEVKDIWGSVDPVTGDKLVLCAVSNQFEPGDRKILRINSQGIVDSLHWRTERERVASIWFSNERRIFVCGGGVYIRNVDGKWVEQTTVPLYYTYRVRGIAINDLFVVGGFGLITHYNGVQWRVWENLGALIWYSAAANSDGVFVVGQTSNHQAVVMRMRR